MTNISTKILGVPLLLTLATLTITPPSFAATSVCAKGSLPALPDVTITSVTQVAAPAPHCKVSGVIGSEINFELLLPDKWNSKFVFGGFAGGSANWAQDTLGALQKGYATVGTDTGHRAQAQDASWALNNLERLENFGHQAVHRTTVNPRY